MAKDPAFLFYASDFLTGVQDLTIEERGQYITLLCIQHQKGPLSEKTIRLAVGNATADVLAKFKQDENGLYYNERLVEEINKRKEHSDKQRQRAKDGWEKRKANESHGNATAMPLESENEIVIKDKDVIVVKDKIPSYDEFFNYALTLRPNVKESDVRFKYNAWVENGWKTGKGKKIVRWKGVLANTIGFFGDEKLSPIQGTGQAYQQVLKNFENGNEH